MALLPATVLRRVDASVPVSAVFPLAGEKTSLVSPAENAMAALGTGLAKASRTVAVTTT